MSNVLPAREHGANQVLTLDEQIEHDRKHVQRDQREQHIEVVAVDRGEKTARVCRDATGERPLGENLIVGEEPRGGL